MRAIRPPIRAQPTPSHHPDPFPQYIPLPAIRLPMKARLPRKIIPA